MLAKRRRERERRRRRRERKTEKKCRHVENKNAKNYTVVRGERIAFIVGRDEADYVGARLTNPLGYFHLISIAN